MHAWLFYAAKRATLRPSSTGVSQRRTYFRTRIFQYRFAHPLSRAFPRVGINANRDTAPNRESSVFRVPFLVAISLVIAFGGGIVSTLVALEATSGFGSIKIGAWNAFPESQTIEADPYAKAHRADAGKLLYGTAEGLAFTAANDSSGQRLTGQCRYTLTGNLPPARFWTIYVADQQGNLLDDGSGRPIALNSRNLLHGPEGGVSITLASKATPFNWLAVPTNGDFKLVLTLLDTPIAGSAGLIDITMPTINKTDCGNA